jgi:multidrug efflux pump subunit AcrA (membrane-fusion protein)
MFNPSKWPARLRALAAPAVAILATVCIAAVVLTDLPAKFGLSDSSSTEPTEQRDSHEGDDHAAHDPGNAGHSEEDSLALNAQARANLNLRVAPVSVGTFTEYIEVPAVVSEWPGRTHIASTSPLTGVINAIYVSRGELIKSGAPLFSLRLTHQDLVNAQGNFLGLLGELDVDEREIARLTEVATSGALAGKTLINRQYERDKRMAALRATKQALLLHGLSEDQINSIEENRELIRVVIVHAPSLHTDRSIHHDALTQPRAGTVVGRDVRFASVVQPVPVDPVHPEHLDTEFLVTDLLVNPGESVETGQRLATLSDYSQILIEGFAYQRDGETLRNASDLQWPLQAVMESSGADPLIIEGLTIAYIGNEVGRQSRALPFYVVLPNQIERSERRGPQKYVSWRYKPGQRLRLRVPIATIDNAIVVPKAAVAEEGPQRYVFVENGDHFDRVPVSIVARDSINVAIANDGQVWPGQSIAINRAHQLQMALKNQSGGGIDPHAGHNH